MIIKICGADQTNSQKQLYNTEYVEKRKTKFYTPENITIQSVKKDFGLETESQSLQLHLDILA